MKFEDEYMEDMLVMVATEGICCHRVLYILFGNTFHKAIFRQYLQFETDGYVAIGPNFPYPIEEDESE